MKIIYRCINEPKYRNYIISGSYKNITFEEYIYHMTTCF